MLRVLTASLAVILALIAGTVQAEMWRCSQPNGIALFTNKERSSGSCHKYVPRAEIGFVSGTLSQAPFRGVPSSVEYDESVYPQPAPEDARSFSWREDYEPYFNYYEPYYDYSDPYGVLAFPMFQFGVLPPVRFLPGPVTPSSGLAQSKAIMPSQSGRSP